MRLALKVYGCREGREHEHGIQCPFASGEWESCHHPRRVPARIRTSIALYLIGVDEDGREAPPAPDWCPLKDRPLTLHRYGGES